MRYIATVTALGSLFGSALSKQLSINIVTSKPQGENCLVFGDQTYCTSGGVANCVKVGTSESLGWGIGLNPKCYNSKTVLCRIQTTWADWAQDIEIDQVYFRDDQCLWDQEIGGKKLKDKQGNDMSYAQQKLENRCITRPESNPFYDQSRAQGGICSMETDITPGNSKFQGAEATPVHSNNEISSNTEYPETENNQPFVEYQADDFDLNIEKKIKRGIRLEYKKRNANGARFRARRFSA